MLYLQELTAGLLPDKGRKWFHGCQAQISEAVPDRKKTSQRNHSTRFLKSPIQHPRHKLEYLCFRGCLNLGAYRACPKMQTNVFLYSPVSFVFLLSLAMSLPIITLPLNNFFRFFPVRTSHLNETGTKHICPSHLWEHHPSFLFSYLHRHIKRFTPWHKIHNNIFKILVDVLFSREL